METNLYLSYKSSSMSIFRFPLDIVPLFKNLLLFCNYRILPNIKLSKSEMTVVISAEKKKTEIKLCLCQLQTYLNSFIVKE